MRGGRPPLRTALRRQIGTVSSTARSPPATGDRASRRLAPRARPGPSALPQLSYSRCQTAQFLRSRGALLRPGFAFLFPSTPMRGERSAERRSLLLSRCRRATIRAARRGARPAGRLASRRSTVAIFGRGPRFHLRHFFRIRAASSSQPGRSAWRAGSRTSRGSVTSRGRRTPLPAPPSARLRRRPSDERGWACVARSRIVVNTALIK